MSQKTNKSYVKRIKISNPKKGVPVLTVRKKGFNHFNSDISGKKRMSGRKNLKLTDLSKRALLVNLPHSNI